MKNLRAGLIGLGMMGRHHARVLDSLVGVDFVGICDPVGDTNNMSRGRPIHDSVTDLIACGLDYAIVAVPTIHHFEIAQELAASGIHTMIEKPLSDNSATARKLISDFSKAGIIGAVGHIERYNPALQEARRRLELLGTLYQIVTRRQGPLPTRVTDIGVINDLATHDIDLTTWITGNRYRSVSARTAHRSGRQHEDLVAVVGNLQNGVITNHLVNWLSPLKERVTILTGENGVFVADTLTADLTFYANGSATSSWSEVAHFRGVTEGDVIRYAVPKKEPLLTEHENFRDAILGKKSDIVTLEQGLINIIVAEAISKSSQIGSMVEILD
jgi:UDP-N-acetylglucosamine 3-dehydrogenase